MSDPELVQALLANILVAIERIERRFQGIGSPEDFLLNDDGVDRLDGIAMMLIAIGEQVKRLDSVAGLDLAGDYPDVDWKGVKGIRDFLSHHYFVVDAEVIYDVCSTKLAGLKEAVEDLALDSAKSDVLLSESSLSQDWDSPEDNAAWADL